MASANHVDQTRAQAISVRNFSQRFWNYRLGAAAQQEKIVAFRLDYSMMSAKAK